MPPTRHEVADYLAALTAGEREQLLRDANPNSIADKSQQLAAMIANTNGNGYQIPQEDDQ